MIFYFSILDFDALWHVDVTLLLLLQSKHNRRKQVLFLIGLHLLTNLVSEQARIINDNYHHTNLKSVHVTPLPYDFLAGPIYRSHHFGFYTFIISCTHVTTGWKLVFIKILLPQSFSNESIGKCMLLRSTLCSCFCNFSVNLCFKSTFLCIFSYFSSSPKPFLVTIFAHTKICHKLCAIYYSTARQWHGSDNDVCFPYVFMVKDFQGFLDKWYELLHFLAE